MKRRYIIVAVSVLVLLAAGWWFYPAMVVASMALADPKGEESGRRACDRIVAVGPRAIPAILRSIRRNSPWSRRYCYLPIALGELGEPARVALVRAIDSENDPMKQAYLISSLQKGFGDFSRFDLWLGRNTEEPASRWALTHFAGDIQAHFEDAPPLQRDGEVNPDFLEWWRLRRNSGSEPRDPPDA